MVLDFNKRSGQPVGSSQFEVEIPDIGLTMGVDEVAGLGAGRITTASHRRSGGIQAYKDHYPMLVETPEVTFTGLYLHDLSDLDQLNKWHQNCAGEVTDLDTGVLTVYKDIKLIPVFRDYDGSIIETDSPIGSFVLFSCICVDLSVSNFSAAAAEASTWTLTVKPKKLHTILGGGA